MALAPPQLHRSDSDTLAPVIPLRPAPPARSAGLLESLFTLAREFASPRPQAAPVGPPPRPPSSPALRLTLPPAVAPDDAA